MTLWLEMRIASFSMICILKVCFVLFDIYVKLIGDQSILNVSYAFSFGCYH